MISILLISEGLGSQMGGPSETIPMFANHLSKSGVDISIICPANNPPDDSVLNTVNIHEYQNIPIFISKVIRFLKPKENEKYLHLNYLWRFEALIVLIYGIIFKPKIILNPRGMLMDDAINSGNRLKEAIFKFFLKPIIMKSVFCFQTSSRVEYESIKSIFPNMKIFLNTLGYQKRQKKSNLKIIPKEKYASRQLVVVSRLDRHKNIDMIIKSFIESKCYEHGWKLKIYGAVKKNDYLDFISPYSFDDLNVRNIFLDTFINEREKIELLRESTFFISASSSESFGVSIAESLDSGTPIILRDNTIWEEYINMGCGFSFSEDQLSKIFIELNDISLDRYNRMMSTIKEKFSPVSWDDHAKVFLENLIKFDT